MELPFITFITEKINDFFYCNLFSRNHSLTKFRNKFMFVKIVVSDLCHQKQLLKHSEQWFLRLQPQCGKNAKLLSILSVNLLKNDEDIYRIYMFSFISFAETFSAVYVLSF